MTTAPSRPLFSSEHEQFHETVRSFIAAEVAPHAGRGDQQRRVDQWWTTELQVRVADRCLQLHGGYGYTTEYSVARAFVDSRTQTIDGGTTEIMKEISGRDLGL